MGRGKIEIKRIENANNRQVTYSKRRSGLIKKAKEISVLCNAKVSLIIFGGSKKMHEYCTPSTKLTDILDEYHRQCGKRLWDAKHENLNSEIDRIKKENDNLQIKLRHLNGQDINSLNHKELIVLEDVLENGLANVRDQKMEIFHTHRRNHKMLEEENKELNYYVQLFLGNLQQLQDYKSHHHMPFTFRVQPLHPNLQERI